MNSLFVLVALQVLNALLTALFLRFGSRLVKAGKTEYGRAMLATLAMGMTTVLLLLVNFVVESLVNLENNLIAWSLAITLAQFLVSILVVRNVMQTTFARALVAWLFTWIPTIGMVALLLLVIKPYLFQAFFVPSNNMAPTIVGWHKRTTCPHCQRTRIMPSAPPEERFALPEDRVGICTSCLKQSRIEPPKEPLRTPDRIVVNKLLIPRRWDIIEFRHPKEPATQNIMRLVGLPGETVYIKEGAIWVNGAQIAPPEHLGALRYDTEVEEVKIDLGTPEKPWVLGPDEYCVLGDFSQRSFDSRFWGPVPGANIEGVVDLRYWPISRWKIFR